MVVQRALSTVSPELLEQLVSLLSAQAQPVPRMTLGPEEAAAALGVSRDFFDETIAPELRLIRRGRRKLVPVRELERWIASEARFALAEER